MKPCVKCGGTERYPQKPNGRLGECKKCQGEWSQAWRKANLRKARENSAKWRRENPERARDIQRRQQAGCKASIKAWIDSQGGLCACCGSREHLQVDHIVPVLYSQKSGTRCGLSHWQLAKDLKDRPGDFQVLCRDCNNWKNNGPRCPCQWWDEVYGEDWRKSL